VSRMPEDGRAVAETKAGGLAPARASESRVWRSGRRRPGRSSRGGGRGAAGGRAEAEARWAGGRCAWAEAGASESRCGGRVAGAQVRSGGDRHAGHGGTDLSRVRERGAGARGIFLDKAITFVGHP
jgi:hypothetical protein